MNANNWTISRSIVALTGSLFALATGTLSLLGFMRPLAYLRSCFRPPPLPSSPFRIPPLIYSLKFGGNTRSYARPAFASTTRTSRSSNTARPSSSISNDMHPHANTTLEEDAKNWSYVPAQGDRPGYFLYGASIHKSPADDREYRIIRLENGLQAVLVHDANTDKAAASLDVAVGHLSDPVSCRFFLLFFFSRLRFRSGCRNFRARVGFGHPRFFCTSITCPRARARIEGIGYTCFQFASVQPVYPP